VELHGAEGREEATGRGVATITTAVMERMKWSTEGTTIALQGFGNVGSFTAQFLNQQGLKIVAVSDAFGGVRNEHGLDIAALLEYARQKRTVKGFPGSEPITNEDVLTAKVDILIPAALGNVLTPDIAKEVQAKLIVE